MNGVQNINYYKNFYNSAKEFKQRQSEIGYIRTIMNPLDRTTRFVNSLLTNYALLPLVKRTYGFFGFVAIKTTSLVSTQLSNWVAKSWDDPVSTKLLLKIGEIIEWITENPAKATPTQWPLLSVIDKCRIQLARHIYIVSKDFNSLLRIPTKLRSYVEWTTIDVSPEKRIEHANFAQKGWFLFKKGTKLLSNALLAIVAKIIQIAAIPLEKIPFSEIATSWIGEKIDGVRNAIHKKVIQKAHDVIDNHEVRIRKSIMSKLGGILARTLTNQALNLGVKLYIGKEIYQLSKYGLAQVIGYQEIPESMESLAFTALKIAGFILLARSIAPTIERLHNDYEEDFNTEASTLQELGSLVNSRNLPKILVFIRNHFKKNPN